MCNSTDGERLKTKNEKTKSSVQCFQVSKLNFNSSDYIDLLNWKDCNVTVPPIVSDMPEEQLKALVIGHSPPIMSSKVFHVSHTEC